MPVQNNWPAFGTGGSSHWWHCWLSRVWSAWSGLRRKASRGLWRRILGEMFRKKPPTEKCSPCEMGHHEEHDPTSCNCMLCNQIMPVVKDMEIDARRREREESWPK